MPRHSKSADTRRQMWRLARRIYGYLGRHKGLFLLMMAAALPCALVDRGRAYLVKPVMDIVRADSLGVSADCPACRAHLTVPEGTRHCRHCGGNIETIVRSEKEKIDKGDTEPVPLHVWCSGCSERNPNTPDHRFCNDCGTSLDSAVNAGAIPPHYLYILGAFGVGFSLLIFPLKYGRVYFANKLSQTVLFDLRNDINSHLLGLPLRYFHNRRAGDLISRVSNDATTMQNSLNFLLEDVFVQPLYLLTAVGLVMYANWMLGLLAIVFFPLYALPLVRIGRAMRRKRKKSLEGLGDLTEKMTQMYSGIRVVKAFGREEEEKKNFISRNLEFVRRILSVIRKKALGESVVEVFISFGFAIGIIAGAHFLGSNQMTTGDMALFVLGLAMINAPVKELSKGYNRLQESLAAGERIFEILDALPEEPDAPDALEIGNIEKGIEYAGVTFAYRDDPVLQDISFHAAPGELIAFVGRSGAGKSTLLDLLCRYYDPQSGAVLVDGKDLRKIRRADLRSHVGVVAQETFLFNTTLEENILYGRPSATREEMEEAARAAMIHDFILDLDEKYGTVVGERGAKLSGGQRQRVAIARAILRNPSILILDEATSALDTEAEKQVQAALANLIQVRGKQGITFVIAHRLSTIRQADRIIVLDEGRIVENGKHDELLKADGVYAQLHRLQFEEKP